MNFFIFWTGLNPLYRDNKAHRRYSETLNWKENSVRI